MQPYLQSTGIQAVMTDGSLHLGAALTLQPSDAGLHASLDLHDLRLSEHGQELAGCQRCSMPNVQLGRQETLLGDVSIEQPRLRHRPPGDQTLALAGVRLTPPPAMKPQTSPRTPLMRPTPPDADEPSPPIHLRSLHVHDAAVQWTDLAVSQRIDLALSANLNVAALVLGKPGSPAATMNASLAVPGCVDKFRVSGHFTPSAQSPSALLDIDGAGLRLGPLAAYLPPGIQGDLHDGRLRATLDAAMQPNPQGGRQAHLYLRDVDFRDGQAGPALVKFHELRLMLRASIRRRASSPSTKFPAPAWKRRSTKPPPVKKCSAWILRLPPHPRPRAKRRPPPTAARAGGRRCPSRRPGPRPGHCATQT